MPVVLTPIEETVTTVGANPDTPGTPSVGENIAAEAIIFGAALIAAYVVFRLLLGLLPILLTVGCLGIAGYLGFKLL
jgi:hypothetical protein